MSCPSSTSSMNCLAGSAAMRESKWSTKHRAAPVCPSSASFSAGVLSRAGR